MFDSSSYDNPTPLALADTLRDALPRGGTSQMFLQRAKLGITRARELISWETLDSLYGVTMTRRMSF
ncbi:hypothetical protein TNCV_2249711 [Trichonephila clavipes]|nr:hypothetical protein TNCV_2249711 [Trichonephila clavipes]